MCRDEINRRFKFSALGLGLLLWDTSIFAAMPLRVRELEVQAEQLRDYAANLDIASVRGLPSGSLLRVVNFNLDQANTTDLVLERFDVFAPDAQIYVDGANPIVPPTDAYFRGHTTTMPQAVVVLTVPQHGAVRGLITDESGVWIIDSPSGNSGLGLSNRKVNLEAESPAHAFECGTEQLAMPRAALPDSVWTDKLDLKLAANVTYTARIAIETDYEFFAKFGNETAASQYIGNLFAYISTVYEREVNTNLVVSYIKLWPGGAGSDPWTATDTGVMLDQLGTYWKANNTSISRTITHMLSGKANMSGMAWIGVLCSSPNNGFGYGVTQGVAGNGSYEYWDIPGVTHEIGHNFGSLHTHAYCGIGGVADPVDLCVDGENTCQGMSELGLPGVDSLTGGVAGTGTGTLMSYCHMLDGWSGNLSYTFGLNHTYGRVASRVPAVMRTHVQNMAAANPTCLALQGGSVVTVPTAVTNPATGITATAASLKGTVTPNGAATTVTFDFGVTTNYGTSVAATPGTINATAAATAVVANKAGLTCNTTYNYRVKALNSAGSSNGVNASFKTAICAALTAPSSLVATVATSTKINLSWRDNSSGETGFNIERKIGAAGTWVQIATVAANVVSYQNAGLTASTTYYYRVRAYNATANSGYSNAIGIITPANCSSSNAALTIPGTANGALAVTDCKSTLRVGSYYDNFTFAATAGKQYTITLNSAAFNAFAYLRNSAGTVLASNDNSNGGTNAKIVYTPTVTGNLTVHATSFAAGSVGAYTVTGAVAGGSTVLFNNGFEIITQWDAEQVSGFSGLWDPVTESTNPIVTPHGGNVFALFNSYYAFIGDSARLYQITGFSVANSYTTVTLKFWMYHDNGYPTANDRIQTQVSTNNGNTWVNVGTPITRYAATNGWTQATINLSAYKGTTLNLGFLGTGDYGSNMAIDDVTVTAQ